MLIVRLLTVEQHTVVHEPHTSECLSKILFLLKRRIETVLVGFMLVHDLHDTIEACKNEDAYIPMPKGRSITRILISWHRNRVRGFTRVWYAISIRVLPDTIANFHRDRVAQYF